MPDPLSIAIASFTAIKAGVSAGKEIQSLAKDIGSLWDSIDAVKNDHSKKKNSVLHLSANEEAMETFIAKKRADDMENELRNIVIMTRGLNAWQELIQLRVQIKKDRIDARKKAIKARRELLEMIGISVLAIAVLAFVCVIGYFIWKKQQGLL
jgi:transcription initiation factor TFIIIB Brf1 subunit/transcription initiation factor TFIIB|tara:strand:- start:586 stop:1044 length:459 start_codon:yes stop_codon:yes gene_type:complete